MADNQQDSREHRSFTTLANQDDEAYSYQATAGHPFYFQMVNQIMLPQTTMPPNTTYSNHPPEGHAVAEDVRYWKAEIHNVATGEEGWSPYLDLADFDLVETILDPRREHDIDSELIFENFQDAMDWRSSLSNAVMKPDFTIPRSLKQKKAIVKLLFKAFKSIRYATDNPHIIKPFQEGRHSNARVECLCWTILEDCIRRSKVGSLLLAYNPQKAKDSPKYYTFAERMNEIVKSMTEQKSICKHLLDAPYVNTFIDNPVKARDRVESNRHLNKRKGDTMKIGKKLQVDSTPKRLRRSTRDEDESDDQGGSNYTDSSPAATFSTPIKANYLLRGTSDTANSMSGRSAYTPFGGAANESPDRNNSPLLFHNSQHHIQPMSYLQSPSMGYGPGPTGPFGYGHHVSLARPIARAPTRPSSQLAYSRPLYDQYENTAAQIAPQSFENDNLLLGIGDHHFSKLEHESPAGGGGGGSLDLRPSFTSAPRQQVDPQPPEVSSPKLSPSVKTPDTDSDDDDDDDEGDPSWHPA